MKNFLGTGSGSKVRILFQLEKFFTKISLPSKSQQKRKNNHLLKLAEQLVNRVIRLLLAHNCIVQTNL